MENKNTKQTDKFYQWVNKENLKGYGIQQVYVGLVNDAPIEDKERLCGELNSMVKVTENTSTSRNWEEDYESENGNYMNKCVSCKNNFFGHKRRVTCKECEIY